MNYKNQLVLSKKIICDMHLILSRPIVMVRAHAIQGWFGSGKQIALSCGKLVKHAV